MSILHGSLYKHLKDIRTDGKKKSYEARIPILMFLISTANMRLRTWHGIKAIMEYTGYSRNPVIEAINWLESRGAIYNVPKEARTGTEKRVHANRKVLQLTGILQLGETIIDYLYLKNEDRASILLEIQDHAPEHVKKLFVSLNLIKNDSEIGSQDEPKKDKIKIAQNEIGSQNKPKNSEISSQNELKIGSQNGTAKELGKYNLINKELDKNKTYTLRVGAELSSKQIKELETIHELVPLQNQKIVDTESDIVKEAQEHLKNTKAPEEKEKEKSSAKKEKEPKARNRLYDMIALVCFDLKPEAIKQASKQTTSRIGKIKKELLALEDSVDENSLADEFWLFKKAYKNKFPDATIPRAIDKVILHFLSLRHQPVVERGFVNTRKPTAEDYAVNNDVDYTSIDQEAFSKLYGGTK